MLHPDLPGLRMDTDLLNKNAALRQIAKSTNEQAISFPFVLYFTPAPQRLTVEMLSTMLLKLPNGAPGAAAWVTDRAQHS